MMRFSKLTRRNLLIATHDALATTLAVLASFYLRFEGESFSERLPLLMRILPYFILLSVIVCYAFNLTTTKWRFISLPDALAVVTSRPAALLGIAAGKLSVGDVADVCIFDAEAWWTVDRASLRSQGKNTPFLGLEVPGKVRHVIVAGRLSDVASSDPAASAPPPRRAQGRPA